jgi:predicted nucleotidyltransferase
MGLRQLIEQKKEDILRLAGEHGAKNVRVFGSVARREDRIASDLDLLVELEPGRSLLDQIALEQDLRELIGVSVDVVVDGGISPYLEKQILAEAVPL